MNFIMPSASAPSVPLCEIVVDRMAELAVEKDAEMMAQVGVAQKDQNANGDGNDQRIDATSNKTSTCTAGDDANNKTTIDAIDSELPLKLRELLIFNKRGSVDTSTTVATGNTNTTTAAATPTGRRHSVDTGRHENQQADNEREHDEALFAIRRDQRLRRASLGSLGEAGPSANLRDHLLHAGRSASTTSLGRRPSLSVRRRHSICYSIPPPGSATAGGSERSLSNSSAVSTPRAPDRRASMSCVDARSVSLSSIITECHPLSIGIGIFSSDDESSDDDASVGE